MFWLRWIVSVVTGRNRSKWYFILWEVRFEFNLLQRFVSADGFRTLKSRRRGCSYPRQFSSQSSMSQRPWFEYLSKTPNTDVECTPLHYMCGLGFQGILFVMVWVAPLLCIHAKVQWRDINCFQLSRSIVHFVGASCVYRRAVICRIRVYQHFQLCVLNFTRNMPPVKWPNRQSVHCSGYLLEMRHPIILLVQ